MTNALTTITEGAAKTVGGLMNNGLGLACNTFDDVWRMSQVIARSGFVPKGITTPEQVSVQIMTGMELGLRPMVAVQNIAVINNKAAIPGDLALAIILTSGLLEEHEEEVLGEGDSRIGVCRVKRKGMKGTIERRFSVADAKKAGLWETQPTVRKSYWDKAKGQRVTSNYDTPNDSPWWKYQDRMLVMRARGFAFRDRFSDVLKGLHLSEEFMGHEIEHEDHETAPAITGPSAPDDEVISEAEIVQAQQAAPRRESPTQTPATATRVDDAPAQVTEVVHPDAGDAQEEGEEFDQEGWVLERRVDYNEAKTEQRVDQIHEMFEDTAGDLPQHLRIQYEDAHQEALARFATSQNDKSSEVSGPDAPDDDEAGGDFPGNSVLDALRMGQEIADADARRDGDAPDQPQMHDDVDDEEEYSEAATQFMDDMDAILEAEGRTHTSIKAAFDAKAGEFTALLADGDLSADDEVEIRNKFRAEYKRLRDLAGKPAGTGDAAADAMTEFLRFGLAKCPEIQAVNDLATSTLVERNAFGSKHPLYGKWKEMIVARRKELSAIG